MSKPRKRKLPAKGQAKQSFSSHRQGREKEGPKGKKRVDANGLPVPESPHEKAALRQKDKVPKRQRTEDAEIAEEFEFRKEWDFRDLPLNELEGCFLYEYARESRTILDLAKGLEGEPYIDGSDWSGPILHPLMCINGPLSQLLAGLVPDVNLEGKPWQSLSRKLTREEGWQHHHSFRTAYPHEESNWGQWRAEMEAEGLEISTVRINWNMPLHAIEAAALAWLRTNPNGKATTRKKGRHANDKARFKDGLRMLGALRLWARYSLKRAIEISAGYQPNGDSIYSGYLDNEGRPAHQSAWQHAVEGAAKTFRETFSLGAAESPLSLLQLNARRAMK
jgi:hypothetical protein